MLIVPLLKMAVLATFGKLEASEPRVLPNWLITCWAMNCWSGIRWPVVGSIESWFSGAVAGNWRSP